jgi:hypothetical protein
MYRTKIILYWCKCALFAAVVFALLFLCASCAEGDDAIRRKLDVILDDDLAAILEDVAAEALIEKPYFELIEYKEYDEGAYSRMAIADFFFIKPAAGIVMKVSRKYRYHRRLGMWDRYYNVYKTVAPDAEDKDDADR